MKGLLYVFVVIVSVAIVRAQTFDVASIKQNKSGATGGQFGGPPSRFTATNTPARAFITFAYRVQDFLIEGAPDWVRSDRWDIQRESGRHVPGNDD